MVDWGCGYACKLTVCRRAGEVGWGAGGRVEGHGLGVGGDRVEGRGGGGRGCFLPG